MAYPLSQTPQELHFLTPEQITLLREFGWDDEWDLDPFISDIRRHGLDWTASNFGIPTRQKAMYNISDNDQLCKSLLTATITSERIVRREHIKADRIERVNHFLTCLRRELLRNGKKYYAEELCQKKLWYDICRLSPYAHSWLIPIDELEMMLEKARKIREKMKDNKGDIEHELKELGMSIHGMDCLVEDMQKINKESEEVLSKLVQLFPS